MDRLLAVSQLRDAAVFHPCPVDPACPYCTGSVNVESAGAFDWSFLDGVYCISLQSREDRAASAAAEFHRVGLCRHVLFYRPVQHPHSRCIGIWDSHRAVGLHALQRGCGRTLIAEDDVLFHRHLRPQRVRAIGRALDILPSDWMIFFLGHWPLWAYFVRPNVLRTGSACAHGYIASLRLLRWLHDHPHGSPDVKLARIAGAGIDAAYARLPATYALFPMVALQSASRSDHLTFDPKKPKRKLKHFITRSRKRERLLSNLMRPNEIAIAMLSPLFFAFHEFIQLCRHFEVLSASRSRRS
jgi:hypothetical protein